MARDFFACYLTVDQNATIYYSRFETLVVPTVSNLRVPICKISLFYVVGYIQLRNIETLSREY